MCAYNGSESEYSARSVQRFMGMFAESLNDYTDILDDLVPDKALYQSESDPKSPSSSSEATSSEEKSSSRPPSSAARPVEITRAHRSSACRARVFAMEAELSAFRSMSSAALESERFAIGAHRAAAIAAHIAATRKPPPAKKSPFSRKKKKGI